MKWVVILKCATVLVIIAVGGIVWFMINKFRIEVKNEYADTLVGRLINKGLKSGYSAGNTDNHKGAEEPSLTGNVARTTGYNTPSRNTQKNRELKEKAQAVLKQNQTALKEYGFPEVRDILKVEVEEERLRSRYNTIRDITQLYLERMGIRDILQSIAEMAVYIPQGLREYDEVKQILPLHVSVWNTSANTLKRQTAKLFLKYEKLMQLEKETELADIETKTEELLKNVRTAWYEYKSTNGSQDSIWKLQRAVEAYPARKTAAEESLRTYGMAVSEKKKADVLALCRSLKELMDSDTFRSLEMYEVHDGEKVSVDMDGEELYLDPTTKAYWDKVGFFAADIQNFLNKWDEKFES